MKLASCWIYLARVVPFYVEGALFLLALAVWYLLLLVFGGFVYGLQLFVEFLAGHTEDFE